LQNDTQFIRGSLQDLNAYLFSQRENHEASRIGFTGKPRDELTIRSAANHFASPTAFSPSWALMRAPGDDASQIRTSLSAPSAQAGSLKGEIMANR
jgi:hypothetical protein